MLTACQHRNNACQTGSLQRTWSNKQIMRSKLVVTASNISWSWTLFNTTFTVQNVWKHKNTNQRDPHRPSC